MTFKKNLLFLIAAMIPFSFSGCSQAETPSESSETVNTTKIVTSPESDDPFDFVLYGYWVEHNVLEAASIAADVSMDISTLLVTASTMGLGMSQENAQIQMDISAENGVWTTTLSSVDRFNTNDSFGMKWELASDPVTLDSDEETSNFTTYFTLSLYRLFDNAPENFHIGANIVNGYPKSVYYTEYTSLSVPSVESAFSDEGWDESFCWEELEGVSTEKFIVGTSPMIKNN